MGDQVTSPADVAKVIEAADTVAVKLSPAEAHAWTVMDALPPEIRAALMARLDNNEE